MKIAGKAFVLSQLLVAASFLAIQAQDTPQAPPAAPAASPAPAPSAQADSAPPASAPAAQPVSPAPAGTAAAPQTYLLSEGSDVSLTFDQDISSKTASEGDPVQFVLADDLKVGNVIVAKAGSIAVGEVAHAEKNGMLGKAGSLDIRLDYLKVGPTKVKLRGTRGNEGGSGTGSAVALTVLFGPIGLIKHGHNVDIKKGTALKAYIADDTNLPAAM
jgi:glucose/arabinose dehydrogenase